MRKRNFLILLAATVLMVAAAIYAVMAGDRAVSPAAQSRPAFPGLAAHLGDLAWMRLEHGAMAADFARIGGRWAVVEKGNYPAAAGRVRRLLLGMADLVLLEPKTRRPDLYARLGLDDPKAGHSTLVVLQNRTGKRVAELIVGRTRPDPLGAGHDEVYIRMPGEQRTWLAQGALDVSGGVADWLDRRIVDIPAARIASVRLTAAGGGALVLRRAAPGGRFAVADPPSDAKFKGEAALAAPAGALAGLELDDVMPVAALSPPPTGVATAEFATFDGLTITLHLFTRGATDWASLAAAGHGKAAAEGDRLAARLAHWTYAIPSARAKLLRTRLADLIAPAKGS